MASTSQSASKSSRHCCCAFGCSNTPIKDASLTFHRFPPQQERRDKWIEAVSRKDWKPNTNSVLCSKHFGKGAYRVPPNLPGRRAMLYPNAVPTIFPEYPAYLRPPQPKRRRVLSRDAANTPSSSAETTEDLDTVQTDTVPSEAAEPVVPDIPLILSSDAQQEGRGCKKTTPEAKVPKLRRRIKTLQQRIRRFEKKERVQRNLIGILEKENKLQAAQLGTIDGVMKELVNNEAVNKGKKQSRSYSDDIKSFAITIHYYSPKAYRYLRNNFSLPSTRTIRSWFETVNCEAGFLVDVLKAIPKDSKPYSLVIDSMAIRKRLLVNKHTHKIDGRVTVGANMEKLATEALVFLLVPILGGPRHPIGYFLVDKIDSDVQQQLIVDCLKLTAENGISIVNITCDGARSNVLTLEKLGAKIPAKPYFKHPSMEHNVYTSLDAVHMLKLARNAFGSLRRFNSENGEIDYGYIEMLHKLQEEMGVRLANKLSKRHMKWQNMKMKVRLAAQMLSSSVADALEYLKQTNPKFKDSEPTIKFIRKMDRLFDILNSSSPFGRGFKSPLTRENIGFKEKDLQEIVRYLKTLTLLTGKPISQSGRKTFVMGFETASTSFIAVSKTIFDTYPGAKYVRGYQMGQDHIETLFSKIRSRGGFNNNPDILSFKSSLKSLLVKSDITPSSSANCIELDPSQQQGTLGSLLFSAKKKKKKSDDEELEEEFFEDEGGRLDLTITKPIIDIADYIGGYVIRSTKLNCSDCRDSLIDTDSNDMNDDTTLVSVKNRGGLVVISPNTKKLFVVSEQLLRNYITCNGVDTNVLIKTRNGVLNHILLGNLHGFMKCAVHSTSTIRSLIHRYIMIRVHYETQKITSEKNENIRSKLNRLVIFQHQ